MSASKSNPRSLIGRFWPLGLIVLAGIYMVSQGSVALRSAAASPLAPDLVVRDLDGNEQRLAELRGQVVLINLWASWCAPCRREIPRISRVRKELGERGLVVWGLARESLAAEELRAVALTLGIDYPVLRPVSGLRGALAGENVLPYNWLIDRAGRVRLARAGLVGESALRGACLELLEEPRVDGR